MIVELDGEIAVVEVIGAQRFQVTRELLFRVLVVLGIPAQPARCLQNEQLQQILLAEGTDANQVDLFDLGNFTFFDGEIDADAVAVWICTP